MPSLIPGYEYDIFISYRQKDNKGDHWVSEFVEALKTELESTFKEEISVYFDTNPHDGLLESHDVAESLREKLKCLVFIPVVSRTYCDSKSFAWEHEFTAFIRQASEDSFGLKVRVENGNISCRVLPVIIHELDTSDIHLCESSLGSVLRGIEFIYSEPGVNRPLNPDDDEKKNLNKTRYKNQINKVANAIREIIGSFHRKEVKIKSIEKEYPKNNVKNKSLIVLPFDNLSPDPEQEYFSDGLTDEIITDLSCIHDLLVISRSSAMTFRGSKKTIPEIAKEVNVRYVLEGSVRKSGNNLRITAQLIDSLNDTHIWAEKFNGTIDDIFEIQEKVSGSISQALKLKLTGKEKNNLSKVAISDMVSYEFYIQAKKYMWSFTKEGLDHALKLTNEALAHSGDNALLYATRSLIFWQYQNTGVNPTPEVLEKGDMDADKALELDYTCAGAHRAKASIAYTRGQLELAVREHLSAAELEIGGESLSWLGYLFAIAGFADMARDYGERAVRVDPLNDMTLSLRGIFEMCNGNLTEAISFLQKAAEINTYTPMHNYFLAVAYYHAGNHAESENIFKLLAEQNTGVMGLVGKFFLASINLCEKDFRKFSAELNKYAIHDKEISWFMADCCTIMGYLDEALYWIENSINEGMINHFFYLINPIFKPLHNMPYFNKLIEKAKTRQGQFRNELESCGMRVS